MNTKKPINIFIVDDNKLFALTLKASIETAFKDMDIKIYSFETGELCMEEFIRILPELVILDYYLNSKYHNAADGLLVLDEIKKHRIETSVIMLTSNNHIEVALKSFNHGASDYVIKTKNQFEKINESISKIFTKNELDVQNQKKAKKDIELIIANKEFEFQKEEKQKRAKEIGIINKKLAFQNEESKKRAAELMIANKELDFQNEEKEKRATELIIANLKKAEIERSNFIIEEKIKDITDSLNYAKLIQRAKLPKIEDIYRALPNCFVLFKPKAIVSGDFYFFHKNTQSLFIAAADCTGHGVPGAFMSMICSEKLNSAVAHSSDNSDILNRLNKEIKKTLHQSDNNESPRDGMDIALCSVNTETFTVKYAGANRPLWIIRKGQSSIEEIAPTKKAIGGFTDDEQHFDNHKIKLQQGDTFYIFTDGYVDQFGGEKGKKLMTKNFKEILLSIQHKSMQDQKNHLDDYIENWKADTEQVDDILVIGIRL